MNECAVTYFKNHALQILRSIAETGSDVVITKHGKPLAHIEPARNTEVFQLGKLSGTIQINDDITKPVAKEDWNANK